MNLSTSENLLVNTSFVMLLTSLIVYWTKLAFPKLKLPKQAGLTFTILTNCCVFASLSIRWIGSGYFPLSNLYESLLFLTWCLTLTHGLLEYKYKSAIIGAITAPISLFVVSFASFSLPTGMQESSSLVPALRSNWLMMHVTVMMISYASLITGSLLSMLFLIISAIKKESKSQQGKKENSIYTINNSSIILQQESDPMAARVSLLESIDNLSYRTIGLGFPMLTVGIIAGAVWANEAWGSYWSWDPKETWALITWLIFASYLHSRLAKSWKGKKPAILASIGFLAVWICYLGVNFLGKGLHSYGWLQ